MESPAATGAAQVSARLEEYLAVIRAAGEREQAAVGHGLNTAYAFFRDGFKTESAFRAADRQAQEDFLLRLDAALGKLDAQAGTAWGLRLFWMYARLMMEPDAGLALRFGPELESLGAKGRTHAP